MNDLTLLWVESGGFEKEAAVLDKLKKGYGKIKNMAHSEKRLLGQGGLPLYAGHSYQRLRDSAGKAGKNVAREVDMAGETKLKDLPLYVGHSSERALGSVPNAKELRDNYVNNPHLLMLDMAITWPTYFDLVAKAVS